MSNVIKQEIPPGIIELIFQQLQVSLKTNFRKKKYYNLFFQPNLAICKLYSIVDRPADL
jgi:hypothetical protein